MSDNDHDHPAKPDAAYEVGYGKPPKASRFKPGQSGNPKGRKKGKKSLAQLFKDILDEKITVREGQILKTYSAKEVMLRQIVKGGMKGDAKAITTVIMAAKSFGLIEPERDDPDAQAAMTLTEEDQEIVSRLLLQAK